MKKILIHGTGHKAASWKETISCMNDQKDILCPDLCSILKGKEAVYENLYSSLIEYMQRPGWTVPPVRSFLRRDPGIELYAGFSGKGRNPCFNWNAS